jgi:transposase InsO family protein
MWKEMRFPGAAAAPKHGDGAVWDVDVVRKPSGFFECRVADANSGTTLARHALKSGTSDLVCGALEKAIHQFGIPEAIRSDAGVRFVSDEFRRYLAYHGIKHIILIPLPERRRLQEGGLRTRAGA